MLTLGYYISASMRKLIINRGTAHQRMLMINQREKKGMKRISILSARRHVREEFRTEGNSRSCNSYKHCENSVTGPRKKSKLSFE